MEQRTNTENRNNGAREGGENRPAGQSRGDRNRRPRRRGQERPERSGDGAQGEPRRTPAAQEGAGSRGAQSGGRNAGRQGGNANGAGGNRGGVPGAPGNGAGNGNGNGNGNANGNGSDNGGANRGSNNRGGRGRGRDGRNRGGQARGGRPDNVGRTAGNEREEVVAETDGTEELKSDFYVSPRAFSQMDALLADTFSPLHESEVYDPVAEAEAKRILDAEGPLLFREERVTASPADAPTPETEPGASEQTEETEKIEIVGVRFKHPGKVYYFAPGQRRYRRGEYAIVETARGAEYGEVWVENTMVPASEVVLPLRPVLRAATGEDARRNEENAAMEQDALRVCREKITRHKLDMKLVEAQYTFDRAKLLFYFTSEGRVDFRELVKDLAGVFRTRIELRQIGIRDEAKMLGGLGTCGRPLCCAGFLSDFVQVSIKMAKEQSLSLNSAKISGCCGRLMCCLRYEFETYEDEIRRTPPVDSLVRTPDGDGVVIGNNPLRGTVLVRFPESADGKTAAESKTYHRDAVQVTGSTRKGAKAEPASASEASERDKGRRDKSDKGGRSDRSDKSGRGDKTDKTDKTDKVDKTGRIERENAPAATGENKNIPQESEK